MNRSRLRPRLPDLRPQQPRARHDLPQQLPHRPDLVDSAGCASIWRFYMLIFQLHAGHRRGTGWGKYQFFLFLATGLLINSLVQTFFMTNADEFSELIRTRQPGFRAAEADRHPVPRLACGAWTGRRWAISCWGWCCWRYSLVQLHYLAGPGGDRALSALRPVRRGDLLQPDDHLGGHQRVAGPQPDAATISGSTSPIFPAIRWRFTAARGARRCGGCLRSASRCWWW